MDKVKRQDSLSSYASRRDGDSCRMLEDKWRNKENGFIDVLSQQEDVLLMDVRGDGADKMMWKQVIYLSEKWFIDEGDTWKLLGTLYAETDTYWQGGFMQIYLPLFIYLFLFFCNL